MRVLVVVLSMMIGAAGCARKVPETPQPTPATADASPPAATAPATPSTAPPSTVTNNPEEDGAKPPQATTAKPAAPASPEKPDAFDASEAIRVDSARRTRCASDARETCAVNGYGEARADETRDAGADDEARDTAGSNSSKANGSGAARDVTEPDAGSHGAEGAAQVDEGHRPHDEADAEESGGRSAGRIP